jgi:hypothetical protein
MSDTPICETCKWLTDYGKRCLCLSLLATNFNYGCDGCEYEPLEPAVEDSASIRAIKPWINKEEGDE